MTKLDVSLTLSGTITSVTEKNPALKSRKGYEIGQNKIVHHVQTNGITSDEWTKRLNSALAMLSTGKGAKLPSQGVLEKRLKDAETQIEDLTNQLNEANLKIEELNISDMTEGKKE